ncbi:MAG: o-succinylbenzoate synthase [Candidatus Nanohaloarchaea archaeon]
MDFDKFKIHHIKLPMKEAWETSEETFEDKHVVVLAGKKHGKWFYGEATSQKLPIYNHEDIETNIHFIEEYVIPAIKKSSSIKEYHENIGIYSGHPMAKAAGDFLLYHLKSFEEDQPISELIGGKNKKVECGVSIGIKKNPKEAFKTAENYLEKGYNRLKLKIKPGKDFKYVKAVKETFPEVEISVDANSAYSLEDLQQLKKLEKFDPEMIEQPLGAYDIINHSKLAEKLQIPICLDESIKSPEDAKKALENNACSIVNLKPQRVGGLYPSKEINNVCKEQNASMWIGGLLESGIGQSFAISAASLSEVNHPCDIAPSTRYFDEDVLKKSIEMRANGEIDIPKTPGLYSPVDQKKISKLSVKTIEGEI